MDLPNVMGGCQGSMWLLVFWLLCAVNIVAAFYMSVAIQKDESILPQTRANSAGNGMNRVKHLFCYDMWMAGYILVLAGFVGWLCFGAGWFATGEMDNDESCDEINQRVGIAYAFGWAYIFCGGCSLCMSLCCLSSDSSSSSQPAIQQQQQSNMTASNALVPASAAAVAPVQATSASTKIDPANAPAPVVVETTPVQASAPAELPVAKATLY